MRIGRRITRVSVAHCLVCAMVLSAYATHTRASDPARAQAVRAAQPIAVPSAKKSVAGVQVVATPIKLDQVGIKPAHDGIAGVPPGFTVYNNEIDSADPFAPGANILMADDLTLASGACDVVYYDVAVGALQGSPEFNVTAELWDGNPCDPGSAPLPNSAATTTLTPGAGSGYDVWDFEVFLDSAPVAAPGTVWLAVSFDSDAAIWPVAREAEVGTTGNFFAYDHPVDGCGLYVLTSGVYAGFYAKVNCDLPSEPTGACCQGTTCSELTQTECDAAAGFFHGPFSTCSPDPCTPGACCSGKDFATCTETSEPDCVDGYFTPNATCAEASCGNNFYGFANVFDTGYFNAVQLNGDGEQVIWADDITLENGATCDLLCFDVLVTGGGDGAPATFNAHVDLRQNVPGDPNVPFSDVPGGVIASTSKNFNGIDSDLLPHRLLTCVPPGTQLPGSFWVTLTTSAPTPGAESFAGPLLGAEFPKVGSSEDAVAVFNQTPAYPANDWYNGIYFGGADPEGCPGVDPCTPAGSFRARVWCRGDAPHGACCGDLNGGCIDGVTRLECPGRWQEGETCDSATFDPPCGTAACCLPNSLVPGDYVCHDLTLSDCEAAGGASRPGKYCIDIGNVCPTNNCAQGTNPGDTCGSDFDCGAGGTCVGCEGRDGDCFSANGSPGCEDPFCCEAVGATDDFCISSVWDDACAETAARICERRPPNDDIANATPISGEGTFDFDNNKATMDGPQHARGSDYDVTTEANDVYYCWTAPCSATVFLGTCNQPTIDTKVAVYDGCTDPSDANLLDCTDDSCNLDSRIGFSAAAGSEYLIRVGTFPGAPGGTGTFSLECSTAGDCCEANPGTVGCNEPTCSAAVCDCDPYCCGLDPQGIGEWDINCATTGFQNSGCGAELLCPGVCGAQTCPDGPVTFINPVDGEVDAGYPTQSDDASILLTPDRFTVQAPVGADAVDCWSLCETAATNDGANAVSKVLDNGNGTFDVVLARPMTPGAVTTLTYTTNGARAVYTSHPGNVNGDSATGAIDILALIDCLNNSDPATNCPWGAASSDVDRSGSTNATDVLGVIDLINGSGAFTPWLNSHRPDPAACAP